jgi:DNA repair exonuclease SbcCD ATPase subunit
VDPKGGLPVYLVDSRIPYLEEKANLYMERLGMADLRISLSTVEEDKETLAVLVDNGFEPRLDIRAFSGGQLDRVEVAIKMALADLAADTRGSKLGLLCYDEPTGGLDEAGKEALAGILFDKAANGYPATYIVSHDPRLSEAFTRRLTVSKAADGSTTVA